MSIGKVWLVGAGPGDGELLTIRGRRALQRAETVVYDALVGSGVLMQIPREAEVIYAGKRQGNHSMSQSEIQEILIDRAREGKRVVRLKGGDPFLFGRGGEELKALCRENIPCEIVPGISSALAVPAYAGIPVTHREYASSVHIITGHRKKGEALSLDFEALSRLEGTLVFLMGVSALSEICAGLLQAGMPPDLPAAVVSHGTVADQRNIISTLSDLPQEVSGDLDLMPAVIIVGNVCALAESLSWREQRELDGIRVVVTRPRERTQELMDRLWELGAQVIDLPSVRMNLLVDEKAFCGRLERCGSGQWIAFTSPKGVELFFDCCRRWKYDIRRLAGVRLAALGPGTARALEDRGVMIDFIPSVYHGAALGRELGEKLGESYRTGEAVSVLIPRARQGNPELIRELESRGIAVEEMPLYETVPEEITCDLIYRELLRPEGLLLTFTSGSTVRCFVENAQRALGEMIDWTKYQAVCIGKQTADVAAEYGMKTAAAKQPTVVSLVEEIRKYGKI